MLEQLAANSVPFTFIAPATGEAVPAVGEYLTVTSPAANAFSALLDTFVFEVTSITGNAGTANIFQFNAGTGNLEPGVFVTGGSVGDLPAFRAVDPADFAPVVTASGGTARTNFSNVDENGAVVNAPAPLTAVTYNEQDDQLIFNPSNSATDVSVDLAQRLADSATVGGFINRIKIGEASYVFGVSPNTPTLFGGVASGSNTIPQRDFPLYASDDATVNVNFIDAAPTLGYSDFGGTLLTAANYGVIQSDPDATVTIVPSSGLVNTVPATVGAISYAGTGADAAGSAALTVTETQTVANSTLTATMRSAILADFELDGTSGFGSGSFTVDIGATGATGSRTLITTGDSAAPTATGVMRFTDQRSNNLPTITRTGALLRRSILDNTASVFTVNSQATTANIAAGTAYDLASFTPTVNAVAGTTTTFASQMGLFSYTPPVITNHNVVFSYTLAATPRNGQVGTAPSNTQAISFYTPWYWTVTASPTAAAPVALAGFANTEARDFVAGQLSITGTVSGVVYLAIETTVLNNRTITLNVDGSATNTDGINVGTFRSNTALRMSADTGNTNTVEYTIIRFGGLAASPTLYNIRTS